MVDIGSNPDGRVFVTDNVDEAVDRLEVEIVVVVGGGEVAGTGKNIANNLFYRDKLYCQDPKFLDTRKLFCHQPNI